MNEKLKQRRVRAKKMKEYRREHSLIKSKENFIKDGGCVLNAKTTHSAKTQCKRLFPLGCLLKGYVNVVNIDLTDPYPECIYECLILPQSSKLPGGRSAFSNREELSKRYHGIKGQPLEWIKPEWFEVELYN